MTFIGLSATIITRLTTTARIGMTGSNGTRKITFFSGYIFLSFKTAKAVGMYWKKRKTTLRVANSSNFPEKSRAIENAPEIKIATTGAFLALVSAIFLGSKPSSAIAAPGNDGQMPLSNFHHFF